MPPQRTEDGSLERLKELLTIRQRDGSTVAARSGGADAAPLPSVPRASQVPVDTTQHESTMDQLCQLLLKLLKEHTPSPESPPSSDLLMVASLLRIDVWTDGVSLLARFSSNFGLMCIER